MAWTGLFIAIGSGGFCFQFFQFKGKTIRTVLYPYIIIRVPVPSCTISRTLVASELPSGRRYPFIHTNDLDPIAYIHLYLQR